MLRYIKRSFSIYAPKLSVRPHVPWYLRWSLNVPFVLAAFALAWWAYGSGLELAGFNRGQAQQELAQLHERVAKLDAENVQLNSQVAQYERQIKIEQASNQETAKQLKNVADENLRLQEDLSFFQNLTATRGKAGELGIHRLRLERDKMPGEYHLRMLVVQSGQRAKEFTGSYQLVATVVQDGIKTTHLFPQDEAGGAQFRLRFKYYQRIEQSIRLPIDVRLENVQIRIFEKGVSEPKTRQSINLS